MDTTKLLSLLKTCIDSKYLKQGKLIHQKIVSLGLQNNITLCKSLINLYFSCHLFQSAKLVFQTIENPLDITLWNGLMAACTKNFIFIEGLEPEKALELFEEMKVSGFKPDSVTLTTVISSCARLLDLERGKEIHMELVRSGFALDGFVSSALVDMYGKCGCLEMAKEVFEQIQRKNVVSWNSMIAGYSLKGDSKSCIELFRRMDEEGIRPTLTTLSSILMACSRSVNLQLGKFIHGYIIRNRVEADIFVNSSLIDLYFKCGNIGSAENVFQNMPKTNVVSWNVMISGYVKVGSYLEALVIFTDMRKAGVKPDAITFTSVLPACSQLAVLEKGKEIHNFIIESKLEINEVLFEKMQQSDAKPDKVTFLAILSACSHAGLVDEGCYYFNQMIAEYGFKPAVEHYSCLIDLLGRVGRLREAYEILQRTPDIREDVGLLSTLFSACHLHKKLDLGEQIGRLLIEKDPDDPSTYIILSNMYASVKKWDEVRKVRLKIKELGLKKNPGCSWIEVGKRIHPFVVEDKSHPQADMIYECMSILASHVEKYQVLSF
ncbi:unnamed protein product, partial [Vitis vinifera]